MEGLSVNLYVASRFSDYKRVREFIDDAKRAGHHVTHDWTRTAEFASDGNPLPGLTEDSLPVEDARHYATTDLVRGVGPAEMVVFFADLSDYCGALVEFGYALACRIQVIVIAPWRASIFWRMPVVQIVADESQARALLGMRERQRAA